MSYLEKDVSDLLQAMAESVDEETGEIRECDALAFDELTDEIIRPKMERMQKARNYIKGEIESLDAEIKRLQGRKKSLQRDDDRLADRIFYGLKAIESWGGKLKTALFTFGTRKSKRLIVEDGAENGLPTEFVKTEIVVNKDALKKHILETGEVFDGVRIEENESLSVR